MTVTTRLAVLGLALSLPVTVLASETAERLTELLAPVRTYVADFEQRILGGSGERLQQASGRMWLARPGRFRWEVEAPYRQVVVSDGEEVILYDPDLEQATVQPLDQRVTHTPALLLSGSADELTSSYTVTGGQAGQTEAFTLTPSDPDTLFEQLRMTFRSERLTGLQMIDSTGQETAITFSDVEQNVEIPDSRFVFDIPDGTDVIRQTP